jgi:hypothetical protein
MTDSCIICGMNRSGLCASPLEAIWPPRLHGQRADLGPVGHFAPVHNPRALMCYCVRNLYVTIRATMLAKISSAGRDFGIIGIVEWRTADRPG